MARCKETKDITPKIELPYIKPTKKIHSTGYRVFEVGTCVRKFGHARIESKIVYESRSDSILIDCKGCVQLDLTKDGYICLFPEFEWGITGEASHLRKKLK